MNCLIWSEVLSAGDWVMHCSGQPVEYVHENVGGRLQPDGSFLGTRWRTDLFELARLREWRDDPEFRNAFHEAKFANKMRLVERAKREANAIINPEALFDLQVKRIHEYKRQLLNILYVIVRYNRIRENPEKDWTPRVVMFAGKAASAYKMAKNIIKLINDVAKRINADPLIGDRLKVGFIPNYGVSVAELIIPAADLRKP